MQLSWVLVQYIPDWSLVDVIGKQHPVVTGVIVWKFNGREILTRIPDNIKPEIIISEEVKQPMVQFYFDEDWLRERVPSSYAADLMEKGRIKLKKVLILKPKN